MSEPLQPPTIGDRDDHFDPVVAEYAGVWRRALESVQLPDLESFLASVPQASRPDLRAALSSVDLQFRQQLADAGTANTVGNWSDETFIGEDLAPATSDEGATTSNLPDATDAGAEPPDVTGATIIGVPADEGGASLDVQVDSRIEESATYIVPAADADALSEEYDEFAPTLTGDLAAGADAAEVVLKPEQKQRRKTPVVAGYEISGILGRGGMGVVYRAKQKGLNRTVALKMILNADHAGGEQLKRFQLEAEAVAQLQHPNIVQVFDSGTTDGLPYLSLEFVEGKSLEEFCDGKPLTPRMASQTISTIARAMQYAHERGIVHRDLKPANVLMTAGGVPKVTDFGLVKRVEAESSQTKTGAIMGTPSYMAPEQAWGQTDVGPAADVYALGATLYCLLTGRPPFQGPTPLETVMQLRHEEPVAPSRLQPGVDRDLETICVKALQKEPQGRYEDATALADDLDHFLRGEPILARPVSRGERVWRWCKRNPALSTAASLAIALALCLMIGGPSAAAMIYKQKGIAEQNGIEAQENAAEAQENAAEAQANAEQALANEELANANAVRAERNMSTARQQRDLAVNSLFFVAEDVFDSLNDRPAMRAVQKNLLLKTLNGLEQVADVDDEEDKTDVVKARSHRKLGDVLLATGLAEQAHGQYERTHNIVTELARAGNPAKPHVPKLNLGRSYVNLGKAAESMGDAPLALEHFKKSLAVRKEALAVAPDPLFVKQEMANAYGHLGNISLAVGQPAAAVEFFEQAKLLRNAWVEKAPQNNAALREFAGVQMSLARAHAEQGQLKQALGEYDEALQSLQKVADSDSQSLSSRGNIAFAHSRIAVVHLYADQPADASQEYKLAVDILKQLDADDPGNALLERKLGTALYGLAVAEQERGESAAAKNAFEKCLALRRKLAQKAADDVSLQLELMLVLARVGQIPEAQQLGEAVSEQIADDASQLFVAAGAYAVASAMETDPQLARQLCDRGIKMLQAAVTQGYRGTYLVEHDPDLDAVRDRAEYNDILKRAAQSPPASAPQKAAAKVGET